MNEELSHTEDMTIEDFLSGATAYEIADNALKRVLVKRKIAFGTMVSELTERQLDLATADIYMWCVQALQAVRMIPKTVTGDGSIRKVVGRPVHTTSGNSVKWRKNCMRNGMKKL